MGYGIGAAISGALGLAALLYRGPGQALVRGHGGDVVVVALLYCLLGLRWPHRVAARTAAVAAIALTVELGQLAGLAAGRRTLATELTVGATFDPWDLLAYALGLLAAVAAEGAARAPGRRGRSRPAPASRA